MDIKYTGIIISKRDIAEADRIYNVFTLEEGKVQLVGRGVRRPNAKLAGSLEPLTESEIMLSKTRGKGNITGVIVSNIFISLKNDFTALILAFSALSHFNSLITQEEKDENLFNMLKKYLEAMDNVSGKENNEIKLEIISQGFIFKLLEQAGYRVEADHCVDCGGKIYAGAGNYFSARKGGVICPDCSKIEGQKMKISDSSIKLIRVFLSNKIENFSKLEVSKETMKNIKSISEAMLSWVKN